MGRGRKIIDKLLNIASGGYYGIISIIIRITCDFIAFLLTPGYNMSENMISEFGRGPGGIFFNLGLIISGIVTIPFYVSLGRALKCEAVNEKLRKIAIIFSIISIITYIFVGIFPSYPENIPIYYAHGIFGAVSWITAVGYLTIYSFLMLKNNKFSKFQAYHGYCVAGTAILFLFTWHPVPQWIMTFAIISWVLINSVFILHYKL